MMEYYPVAFPFEFFAENEKNYQIEIGQIGKEQASRNERHGRMSPKNRYEKQIA